MPLEITEIRQIEPFARAYALAIAGAASTAPDEDDGVSGWIWASGIRNLGEPFTNLRWGQYRQLDDTLIMLQVNTLRGTGPVLTMYLDALARFDSQCLNPDVGSYQDVFSPPILIAADAQTWHSGQMMIESGEQRLYYFSNRAGAIGWFEIDHITLNHVNSAVPDFPSYNPHQAVVGSGDGNFVGINYRLINIPQAQGMMFFEGITDSVGMADVTDGGTNTHALGLALQRVTTLQLSGDAVGDAWAWIDVDTGNAVGFLDIPYDTKATTSDQSEPAVDGNGFDWSVIQFVPDPDSLDAQPKGEIHCFSSSKTDEFSISGVFNDQAETPFTGVRDYVTSYDFNPFGLETGPLRIHNRRNFIGSIDIPEDPAFPGGPDLTVGGGVDSCDGIWFHPPSNAYFALIGYNDFSIQTNPIVEFPGEDDWRLFRWARQPTVEAIEVSPLGEVTTNATVRHEAVVYGEFSFKAAGIALTATLLRASTYEEQFTPAGATSAYIVDAAVIDEDASLEVYEGDVATGTLLTETTNYTVNYATGTITGVDFTPSTVHSVNYRHRSNELSPPHGTLLNSQAISDENGVATFDVSYGDDDTLEDAIDSLTVVSA